ncbi:hypothetical protein MMC30_000277 [Trapelia coarctata]|nr:hypothetical protein [Trapelia coarctata]
MEHANFGEDLYPEKLNQIACHNFHNEDHDWRVENTADCQDAIGMIPSAPNVHPDELARSHQPGGPNRINIHIPNSARERKFFLPAIFRSRSCLVMVVADAPDHHIFIEDPETYHAWHNDPHGPNYFPMHNDHRGPANNAASHMLFTIWPKAKQLAQRIVKRCPLTQDHDNIGSILTWDMLGKYPFHYRVGVTGVPRQKINGTKPFPKEGWRVTLDTPYDLTFNVYEANGTWSGRGTLGHWFLPSG